MTAQAERFGAGDPVPDGRHRAQRTDRDARYHRAPAAAGAGLSPGCCCPPRTRRGAAAAAGADGAPADRVRRRGPRAGPVGAGPTRADPPEPARSPAGPPKRPRGRPLRPAPAGRSSATRRSRQPRSEPVQPAAASAAPPSRRHPRPAAPRAGALDAAAVRRVWDEILGYVRRKSQRAAAVVREATVREVEGDTLVLTFKHEIHANMLANSPELLIEAVYEVLGGQWQVRTEWSGGAPETGTPPVPAGGAGPGTASARAPERLAPRPSGPRRPARPAPTMRTRTTGLRRSGGGLAGHREPGRRSAGTEQPDAPGPPTRRGDRAQAQLAPVARPPSVAARLGAAARHPAPARRRSGQRALPAGPAPGPGQPRQASARGARPSAAARRPPFDPDYDAATAGR